MPKPRVAWFKDILKQYSRIAIVGGPKSGKTTLSRWAQHTHKIIHTDAYMNREWSAASAAVADDANRTQGKIVVEGVAVPRALRKGMCVDVVVLLEGSIVPLLDGQSRMAKSVETVLNEWRQAHPDVPVVVAPSIPKEADEQEETEESET